MPDDDTGHPELDVTPVAHGRRFDVAGRTLVAIGVVSRRELDEAYASLLLAFALAAGPCDGRCSRVVAHHFGT